MSGVTAYIGLGSNLGERRRAIESALARLDATAGVRVVAVSPLIRIRVPKCLFAVSSRAARLTPSPMTV